ncbi:hypothetical protein [Streptantibioticus ferralitis]|uniref:Methyltransferase n=1 Tax=Streptantibioticus ferralitis TaxID=236510 RepID=A0ABT5YVK7_9ACTN|nr:hypothetical protein [Streptantibioticus ferralitis]MDF2255610.1 hypothetical protein [Streptantibioticus ferralitis]
MPFQHRPIEQDLGYGDEGGYESVDQDPRLHLLSHVGRVYDLRSARLLDRLGLRSGSRLLLLGASGARLVRWAAERVGPAGEVVAAMDTHIRPPGPATGGYANVRYVRHDPGAESLPAGPPFDIVHTRLVLGGLRHRDRALAAMVAVLAPHGVLLAEDFDWGSYGPADPDPATRATMNTVKAYLRGCGIDLTFGRRLPTSLRDLGLRDVDAEGLVLTLRGAASPLESGPGPCADPTIDLLRASGLVNAAAAKAVRRRLNDPDHDMIAPTLMSVWGSRPGPGSPVSLAARRG